MFQSVTDSLKTLGELHLKQLTMDNNGINKLNPVFSKYLPELEILSLGNNNIYFEENHVTDLRSLKHLIGLNLSWNIHYATGTSRLCEAHLACPLLLRSKMQWIDISHITKYALNFPGLALINNSTFEIFTVTQSWQCWHYCQLCVPTYFQFSSLIASTDISTCEISNQGVCEDYILRLNATFV